MAYVKELQQDCFFDLFFCCKPKIKLSFALKQSRVPETNINHIKQIRNKMKALAINNRILLML
jgi:hypothetical protein